MSLASNLKIVGLVMVHDNEDYIDILLDDLEKYTDEIYVNANDPTPMVLDAIHKRSSVKKIIYTSNGDRGWSQGGQRDNAMRMLDDIKPDIVLFPDDDEVYPKNLKDQLEVFWNDKQKLTFWFRLLYLWGDPYHFRSDGKWKCIHHVRAMKWQQGITYVPHYAGYACPSNYVTLPRETKFNSNSPTLHYGYMKEADYTRKLMRKNRIYNDIKEKDDLVKLILEVPKELLP